MKLDFVSDNNTELVIRNGDFVISDNSLTQAKIIIYSAKGEIRNSPSLGLNIHKYLGANIDQNLLFQATKKELRKDGLELKTLELENTDYGVKINLEVY